MIPWQCLCDVGLYIHFSCINRLLQNRSLERALFRGDYSPQQRYSGITFCMCPANERWGYIVMSSLIGWAHAQNEPWILRNATHHKSNIGNIWGTKAELDKPYQSDRMTAENTSSTSLKHYTNTRINKYGQTCTEQMDRQMDWQKQVNKYMVKPVYALFSY